MLTNAGNLLSEYLINDMKMYQKEAERCAVVFAETGKPEDRQLFFKNREMSEKMGRLHEIACQYMHAMEQEMKGAV